jgi:hypothetical protein
MLPSAFYHQDGAVFVATELTRGPWNVGHQHGGPPSALLARAVENFGADAAAFAVTRLTVDFLRPIPIGPLTVEVEEVRAGTKAQRHRARLLAGDVEVARATTLRVRRGSLTLPPPLCPPEWTPPPPSECEPYTFGFFPAEIAYHRAVEIRWIRGRWAHGPAAAWFRVLVPLVDGAELTPLERAIVVADASNGVCPVLPLGGFTFVNGDLSVHLYRQPVGDWLALDARSVADAAGAGLVDAQLFDETGPCARVCEGLVIGKP